MKIHLKPDESRRIALCGIFPGSAFRLVRDFGKLSHDEVASVCKVCLMVFERNHGHPGVVDS
ncbi:MAG TPA: hypothetical protein VKX49_13145 [Bryobacteraceae bacterium]|nr:hypothetical protein [Bryobacteraceae bacterium]